MNDRVFKSGIERLLLSAGFERHDKLVRRHDAGAWTVVGIAKGFGLQWYINVGFWLDALGGVCAGHVELTHMYFRLERLFPEHRESIALAGALGDPSQPMAFERLGLLLQGELDRGLRALGTEDGLREAMMAGRLNQGLVRKDAREYLRLTKGPS